MDLVFDGRLGIPNSVLTLLSVPVELFQIFFPTIGQVGDHTDVVQEEPLGLQCLIVMFGHFVSWKTASINPDILTLELL